MEKYRCFRDHLNEAEVGLAYILATYKNKNKDFIHVTLLDEESLDERTVLLPHTVTVQELKLQARALWSYDEMVEDPNDDGDDHDHALQVFAPSRSGLVLLNEKSPWPLKRVSNDQVWAQLRREWALGAAVRRDASLLQYCREACRAVKLGGPRYGASEVLFAARRLANLIALSVNQVALDRLGAWNFVDSAVIDLLESHNGASGDGGLSGISAAATDEAAGCDIPADKKAQSGSSPWVVAAGACLHWGLAHSNVRYRQLQACCGASDADAPTTLPLLRALQWACDALCRRRQHLEASVTSLSATTAPAAANIGPNVSPEAEDRTLQEPLGKEKADTEIDWTLACSAKALDAMVFLCLGALWSNLRCPTTRKRHGTLAMACAVELAVHGGASEEDLVVNAGAAETKEGENMKGPAGNVRATRGAATTSSTADADSAASTAAKSETSEPRAVRWLASHLACYLLVHESELRSGVASSGERVVGGLASLLWHGVAAKRTKTNTVASSSSAVGLNAGSKQHQQRHGTAGRGLSPQRSPSKSYSPSNRRRSPKRATTPSVDSQTTSTSETLSEVPDALSLCGVTVLASLVSTAVDRARMTRSAAVAALAPTLALAEQLSAEVRRGSHRKSASQGGSGVHMNTRHSGSDSLRGARGENSLPSKGASTALEHALVAVWGLLLILRRVPESAGPHATEEEIVANANAASTGSSGADVSRSPVNEANHAGTRTPAAAAATGVDTAPMVVVPKAADSALAALLKNGMNFDPPAHIFKEATGAAVGGALQPKANKRSLSGTGHNPTSNDLSATTGSASSTSNATDSPTVRRQRGIFLVPSTAVYDERNLLDRVLRICAWHRSRRQEPAWAKRYSTTVDSKEGRRSVARTEDAVVDDSTESDDEDSGREGKAIPACAYDPVEDEDDFGASDGEDSPGCGAGTGDAAGGAMISSYRGSGERDVAAFQPQRSIANSSLRGRSFAGAKGLLSEVEVRCSVACVSILAGVAPTETVRRLGCRGVARLLALAEDGGAKPCGQYLPRPSPPATEPLNPPAGVQSSSSGISSGYGRFVTASPCGEVAVFSARVQESAIAALAHLTHAAIVPAAVTHSVHDEAAANKTATKTAASMHNATTTQSAPPQSADGSAPARKTGAEFAPEKKSKTRSEVALTDAKAARQVAALEAQYMLGCVVYNARFIERLARLRASAEVEALAMTTVPAKFSGYNEDGKNHTAGQQRKRKHMWGVAEAASLSIMHLTALVNTSETESSDRSVTTKATTSAARVAEASTSNTTTADIKEISNAAPVKDEAKTNKARSSKRLFKAVARTVIRFAPPPREIDLVQPIGRHLFNYARLALVAEGLWSRNRAVAAQACAALWCLARDSPTRSGLVELSLAASRKDTDHQEQRKSNQHAQHSKSSSPQQVSALSGFDDEARCESSALDGPPAPLRMKMTSMSKLFNNNLHTSMSTNSILSRTSPKFVGKFKDDQNDPSYGLPGPLIARLLACVSNAGPGYHHTSASAAPFDLNINNNTKMTSSASGGDEGESASFGLRGWALGAVCLLLHEPALLRQSCRQLLPGSVSSMPTQASTISEIFAASRDLDAIKVGNFSARGVDGSRPLPTPQPVPQDQTPPLLVDSIRDSLVTVLLEHGKLPKSAAAVRFRKGVDATRAVIRMYGGASNNTDTPARGHGTDNNTHVSSINIDAIGGYTALEEEQQRLVALCVQGLLTLATLHPPSLAALRSGTAGQEKAFRPLEGVLFGLLLTSSPSCRRLRRLAAHLLFLLCEKDLETSSVPLSVTASAPSALPNASKDSSTSTPKVNNTAAGSAVAAVADNATYGVDAARTQTVPGATSIASADIASADTSSASAAAAHARVVASFATTNSSSTPLERLMEVEASVAGQGHVRTPNRYCLERLFLRVLQEEETNTSDAPRTAGAEALQYGKHSTSHKRERQAAAFGFSPHSDGGSERDTLRALALHCLVSLTGRHGDGARRVVSFQGGLQIACNLLREAPSITSIGVTGNAHQVAQSQHNGGNSWDHGGNAMWKRTRPLHLLLNCSTLPELQPSVCSHALDDLVHATFTPPNDHADGALERHLAYATLANLSQHSACRRMVLTHSMQASAVSSSTSALPDSNCAMGYLPSSTRRDNLANDDDVGEHNGMMGDNSRAEHVASVHAWMLNLATFQPPNGAPNRSMVPSVVRSQHHHPADSTRPKPLHHANQNPVAAPPFHSLFYGKDTTEAAPRPQTATSMTSKNVQSTNTSSTIVSSDQPTVSSTFCLTSGPFEQMVPALELPGTEEVQRNDHFPLGANAWHPEIKSAVEVKQSSSNNSSSSRCISQPLVAATCQHQVGAEGNVRDNGDALGNNQSPEELKRQEQVQMRRQKRRMSVLRDLKQQIREGTANLDLELIASSPDGNSSPATLLVEGQIDNGNHDGPFNDDPPGSQDMAEMARLAAAALALVEERKEARRKELREERALAKLRVPGMGSAGDNRGTLHVSVAPVNQTSSHFKFPEPKRTVLVPLEIDDSNEADKPTLTHERRGTTGGGGGGGVTGSGRDGEGHDDTSRDGLSDKQLEIALQSASARKALSKQRRVREASARKAAKVAKAQEAQRRRALKVAQEERRAKHDAAAVANAKNFTAAAAAAARRRSSNGNGGKIGESTKKPPVPSQLSSGGALPPQRLWMWKHVPGSAISAQAGLTPFVVPEAGPTPDGTPSDQGAIGAARDGSDDAHEHPNDDKGAAAQSYFFFHKPSLAAHPFAPPPLPALAPPLSLAAVHQPVTPPGGSLASCGVLTPELWDHAWPSDGRGIGSWALHSGGIMDFAASAWALVGHESIGNTQANAGDESREAQTGGEVSGTDDNRGVASSTGTTQSSTSSTSAITSTEDTELLAVAVGKGTVKGGLPPRTLSVIVRGPRTPPQEWPQSIAVAIVLELNLGPPIPVAPAPKQGLQLQRHQQQQQPMTKTWRLADDGLFAPRLKENMPDEVPTIPGSGASGRNASAGIALMSVAAHAAAAPAGLFDGPRIEARAIRLDWRRLLSSRRFYECFEPPPCVAPPVSRNAAEAMENKQMKTSSSQQHSAQEALVARIKLSAQLKSFEDALVDHAGLLNRLFDYFAASHPPVAAELLPFSPSTSPTRPPAAGARAPRHAVAANAVAAAVAAEHGGGGGLGGGGAAGTWCSDHCNQTFGGSTNSSNNKSNANNGKSEWVVCEAALQTLALDLQLVDPNQPVPVPARLLSGAQEKKFQSNSGSSSSGSGSSSSSNNSSNRESVFTKDLRISAPRQFGNSSKSKMPASPQPQASTKSPLGTVAPSPTQSSHQLLLTPQHVASIFATIVDDHRIGVGRSEGGGGGAASSLHGQQTRARGLRRFELVEAVLRLGFAHHHHQFLNDANHPYSSNGGNEGSKCDCDGSNDRSGGSGSGGSTEHRLQGGLWKLGPASASMLRRFLARIKPLFEALEIGPNQKKQKEDVAHKTVEKGNKHAPLPTFATTADLAAAAAAAAGESAMKEALEPVAVFNACPSGRLSQRLNVPNLGDEWRAQVLYTEAMDEVLRKHQSLLDVVFAYYATGGIDVKHLRINNRGTKEAEELQHDQTATASRSSSIEKNRKPVDTDDNTVGAAAAKDSSIEGGHKMSLKVGTKLGVLRRREKQREANRLKNQASKGEMDALDTTTLPAAAAESINKYTNAGEEHFRSVTSEASAPLKTKSKAPQSSEWLPPGLRLTLDQWMQLLVDAGMCGKGKAPWGRQLSRRDARVAWCMAKRVVVDANGVDMQPPPLHSFTTDQNDEMGGRDTHPVAGDAARSKDGGGGRGVAGSESEGALAGDPRPAVHPFAGGAYPGNGVGLDRLAFYEALSRCAEMMAKDLPLLPYDLKHHHVKDIIELERKLRAALDRSDSPPNRGKRYYVAPRAGVAGVGAAAAVTNADSDADSDSDEDVLAKWGTVSYSSSGSGSVTYSTYGDSASDNEEIGDSDDDGEGGGAHHRHSSAIAAQEARRQLRALPTGAKRTDIELAGWPAGLPLRRFLELRWKNLHLRATLSH